MTSLDGVLVVDKACGPTSHDVVAVARRALGTRAVGHTGTLDPPASGALVLVVGQATKLVSMLGALPKEYLASVQLGSSTNTLDAQGEVLQSMPVPDLELGAVRLAAARFCGEFEQRAPLVSAIKLAGKSLHKRARAGEVVEPPLRRVRVDELEVLAAEGTRIELRVRCGKGFYVRALARDLAEALGTLGHLSALRRTHNGAFEAAGAVDFDALRAAARGSEQDRERLRARVLPFAQVCRALPHLVLDAEAAQAVRHGRPAPLLSMAASAPEGEPQIALSDELVPLAIVQRSADLLRVVRGFVGV